MVGRAYGAAVRVFVASVRAGTDTQTSARQTSVYQWFALGAGFVSKARMTTVDAEIIRWSRRRAIELAPVSEEWLTIAL